MKPAFAPAVAVLFMMIASVASSDQLLLPNGMNVLVFESGASDVCGVHLALNIGPERVPPEKAGLRALTQQIILSKIRAQMNTTESLASLRQEGTQGAGFSVETQEDCVEFTASVTSAQLKPLLEFLAPAVFAADWTQDDVVSAREIVLQKANSPSGTGPESGAENYIEAYRLFSHALLGDGPHTQPVFGTRETLEGITLADVKSFYRSYYVPNLASLCIVGPVPARDVIDLATAAFGGFESRKVAPATPVVQGRPRTRVQVGESAALRMAVLVVGIPLPPVGTEGYAAGLVLNAALSGPGGSLAQDEGLANLERSEGSGPKAPSGVLPVLVSHTPSLAIIVGVMPTSVEDARQLLLGKLAALGEKPLAAEELARAKTRAINLRVLGMDEPRVAAAALNRRYLVTGEVSLDDPIIAQIAGLSAETVQAVAAEQMKQHAIGLVMPGN
ncbi:MAG: insulinase family protein [Armatimonadetes bacterium]|nr:insulinase family protein [Armatimonadota bacterium]